MGKFSKDVHPDRSGSMTNRPAVDGKTSSVQIRDTAEGKKVMREGSTCPGGKGGYDDDKD